MHRRARSQDAKLRRVEDFLDAARTLAAARGGVRHLTLAAVTEAAGLHPSAVRRYFVSKEELLLELAERGWNEWRDALTANLIDARNLGPHEVATEVSTTIATLPLFCDLLAHVPLSLEGDVDMERARRYKTNSFAAYDSIVDTLTAASVMTAGQVGDLIAAGAGPDRQPLATLPPHSHPHPALRPGTPLGPRRTRLRTTPHPPPPGHLHRPHRAQRPVRITIRRLRSEGSYDLSPNPAAQLITVSELAPNS